MDQHRAFTFNTFNDLGHVFGHFDVRCDHQSPGIWHAKPQVIQLLAPPFNHGGLIAGFQRCDAVLFELRGLCQLVEIQSPLEARDALQFFREIRLLVAGNRHLVASKIDCEGALVAMEGDWAAIA